MPKRRSKVERYRGPAALGMLRARSAQSEHRCAAGSAILRGPTGSALWFFTGSSSSRLGVSGWMLLRMQVAPATVAMENTLAAKYPAIFMCPSLSWGESPASGEPGAAGSALGRLPPRLRGTVCAGPGFSRWVLVWEGVRGPQRGGLGEHGGGTWGRGNRLCCAVLIG